MYVTIQGEDNLVSIRAISTDEKRLDMTAYLQNDTLEAVLLPEGIGDFDPDWPDEAQPTGAVIIAISPTGTDTSGFPHARIVITPQSVAEAKLLREKISLQTQGRYIRVRVPHK